MSCCLQTDSLLSSGELARGGSVTNGATTSSFVQLLQRALKRVFLPKGKDLSSLSQLAEGVVQKLDMVVRLVTDPPRANSLEESRESV
jgi:hypothetical protein